MTKDVVIKVSSGIDPEVAGKLVNVVSKYETKISISFEGAEVDLKSILGLMSLGVPSGKTVTITVENDDESIIKEIEKIIG